MRVVRLAVVWHAVVGISCGVATGDPGRWASDEWLLIWLAPVPRRVAGDGLEETCPSAPDVGIG